MSVTSWINATTGVLIGILLFIAALIVVFGLVGAYRGRRRPELVITDIVAPAELSASLFAELSEELRSMVHHRLETPVPRESLKETVGKDVDSHLAEIPGIYKSDMDRIQEAILRAPRQELLARPRDALAAASGGIRALKPEQAEGLIQALSAFLPAQRGLLVTSRAVCRRETDGSRMGCSVQVGPISGGDEARATFWSRSLFTDYSDLSFAEPSWFRELLSLAAEWIIVYLIGRLGVEGTAHRRRLRLRRRRYAKRRHALVNILTAQWASYAMYELQVERPDVALEWAYQALEDAQHAREELPHYYYPSYLIGSINELWGNCCAELRKKAPHNAEAHPAQAMKHFQDAAEAFAQAESKLEHLVGSRTFRQWEKADKLEPRIEEMRLARLKEMRIARLKCQLLAGRSLEVLTTVDKSELIPSDLESTINAAALFAVAAWVADNNGWDTSSYREAACQHIIEAARQGLGVEFLRTDIDLNRGIARDDLNWLIDVAPKADDQAREQRLRLIVDGPSARAPEPFALAPGDSAPDVPPRGGASLRTCFDLRVGWCTLD